MLSPECLAELHSAWLPHMTEVALERLIEMLEKGSPLLIHGCFTRAVPMGCLASHIAWNHPETAHLTVDAGIAWLHRVAGLNPATSAVLREWDRRGVRDLELRTALRGVFQDELAARRARPNRAKRLLPWLVCEAVMLPRVLETEAMDTAEEARDYDAMDHSAVNRVFVADFLAFWRGTGTVLDVGTGTAQIPIELARQNGTVRVVGIDLAEHMLSVGRENIARAGLSERVTLQRCDAKALPWPAASFAAVISNSIVHHIPDPGPVLAEMVRVVRPGGALFVRDLLRPADEATLRALVDLHAAGANAHQRQMFADSLHAALSLEEVRGLVAGLGYDPSAVRQTTDRHWTWAAVR